MKVPVYPEHEKLTKVKEQSQWLGGFIEWLQSEYRICESEYDPDFWVPVSRSTEQWLSEYLKIDLVKLEEEKQRMLAEIRGEHAGSR